MSDAKDKTDKADAAAAPKKKSKRVPILLTGILVILAGGGAGAYWFYAHRSGDAAAAEASAPEPEDAPAPGIVELEPFVVNLADPGGQRFLRVSMRLLTYNEDQAAEMKEDAVAKAKLRSAILELLSMQLADPLVTPEGKTELKKAIAEHAAHAVHELKVTDVLFVEFVVQ